MRRFAPAALAIVALAAAAVTIAGTAHAHDTCPHFDFDDLRLALADFDAVVVGEWTDAGIEPEAYLKGSALTRTLTLVEEDGACPRADAPAEGARVIAALRQEAGGFQWPIPAALFVVNDGVARNGADPPATLSEEELVSRIRAISGQYAVLAADPSEGASIDWLGVVLPVTAAAIIILGIALVLLRIWHRIEPE